MLSSVKKSIVQASSSSISRIVNFSLGYGAAVGGFVLSAPLFMHARINNTFQLLLASLAPLLTTIIVFLAVVTVRLSGFSRGVLIIDLFLTYF